MQIKNKSSSLILRTLFILFILVSIIGVLPAVVEQELYVGFELNEILYTVEDKCNEFIQAFHDKRFDDCIFLLDGSAKQRFEQFKQLYQEDSATYEKDIPTKWNVLGSTPGDVANQYTGYADIYFPEVSSSRFKMIWQKENLELLLVQLDQISKSDDLDVSLHLSVAEKDELYDYFGKFNQALESFNTGSILSMLSEDLEDEFINMFVDEDQIEEAKDIFLGSLITTDEIRPGETKGEAEVFVTIEHKDGIEYKAHWYLKRQDVGWKLYEGELEKIK